MPALVALSMLGSACDDGGDAPATTGDDAPTCDASLDSDNDGLDDCREAELGTAPHLADTDGDALTDYQEVVEFGFSSANNNFKFNPLIADTPRIAVDITSAPRIALL